MIGVRRTLQLRPPAARRAANAAACLPVAAVKPSGFTSVLPSIGFSPNFATAKYTSTCHVEHPHSQRRATPHITYLRLHALNPLGPAGKIFVVNLHSACQVALDLRSKASVPRSIPYALYSTMPYTLLYPIPYSKASVPEPGSRCHPEAVVHSEGTSGSAHLRIVAQTPRV